MFSHLVSEVFYASSQEAGLSVDAISFHNISVIPILQIT